MGAIISVVTSTYATVVAVCSRLISSVLVKIVGVFAKLGLKMLSVNWIKKFVDVVKKIGSVLKKTLFNPKVVAVLKYLSAIALCVIAVIQVVIVGSGIFQNTKTVSNIFKPIDVKSLIFFIAVIVGLVYTLVCCLKFLFGIFKKKILLNFISALLFTYVFLLFYHAFAPNALSAVLLPKFTLVNAFALVTVVFAFIKLFDNTSCTSFFGVLFAGVALLIVFLLYKNYNFGLFLNYEIVGEIIFDAKNVNAIEFIKGLGDLFAISGLERPVMSWCNEFNGVFVVSLIKTLNLFIIFACNVFPFILLSLAPGLLVALINDRVNQSVYLSRVITVLKVMFVYGVLTLVFSIITSVAFKSGNTELIASFNVNGGVLTLVIVLVLLIITAISKKLITDKPYMKIKQIKIK